MKVIYVGGMARSGSTLLERLLGGLPDTCGIGESVLLWEHGAKLNELCSCGEHFHDCSFWRNVGQRAFGGWSTPEVSAIRELRLQIDRSKNLPKLALCGGSRQVAAQFRRYTDSCLRLYQAVIDVSGTSALVDCSKLATLAWALRYRPEVDLRIIHLVRDSRGVAYSYGKARRRPGATKDSREFMPTFSPRNAALKWDLDNAAFESLKLRGAKVYRVRYEDLIGNFPDSFYSIAQFCGRSPETVVLPTGDEPPVSGRDEHAVGGNPMRYSRGPLNLAPDEAWRSNLSRRDQLVVSFVTAPLLYRYGYDPFVDTRPRKGDVS